MFRDGCWRKGKVRLFGGGGDGQVQPRASNGHQLWNVAGEQQEDEDIHHFKLRRV